MKKSVKLSLGSVIVAGALGAVLIPAVSASATTTTQDCQAKLSALQAQTNATPFSGPKADSDHTAMLAKIDNKTMNLQAELAAGNTVYVVQKLTDFRTYINNVNTVTKPKPKIEIAPQDAAALIASTDDTISCVSSL